MVGWHHWCKGLELGQTSRDGEGQGGLACCRPWGYKELDTTEHTHSVVHLLSLVPLFATPWQQYTRPLCPSSSPKVWPSSCPLHQWCHPAISSSNALFSFCPQYFPASGTFPMSQLFASDDQNTGVSASASVLPTSIQCWFPLRLIGLISLLSEGLSGVFSSTTVRRHQFFNTSPSL